VGLVEQIQARLKLKAKPKSKTADEIIAEAKSNVAAREPKPKKVSGKHTSGNWKESFLKHLARTGNMTRSARLAGTSKTTVMTTKERDKKFKEDFQCAIDEGYDCIEEKLRQRALERDTIAGIFLLKGGRPEKYDDRARMNVLMQQTSSPPVVSFVLHDPPKDQVEHDVVTQQYIEQQKAPLQTHEQPREYLGTPIDERKHEDEYEQAEVIPDKPKPRRKTEDEIRKEQIDLAHQKLIDSGAARPGSTPNYDRVTLMDASLASPYWG
jgi:hypothetical protein